MGKKWVRGKEYVDKEVVSKLGWDINEYELMFFVLVVCKVKLCFFVCVFWLFLVLLFYVWMIFCIICIMIYGNVLVVVFVYM